MNNKDPNIFNILLNSALNKIIAIIKEDNITFVFLYRSSNKEIVINIENNYGESSLYRKLRHRDYFYKYINEDKFYDS